MKYIIFICMILFAGMYSFTANAQVTPPQDLLLFPLIGQSNMSGRGLISSAPADLINSNPDIYLFGNDYQWKYAVEPLDSSVGQIDTVSKDNSAAVGPGMAFALAYLADHPGVKIGLIPCANGGKTIHEWRRQSLVDSTLTPIRSNLYGSCLNRIHEAQAYGKVEALLIFEGESDTRDPSIIPYAQPHTFAKQFEIWIGIWRADLQSPNLPVVFAQLATTTDPTLIYWAVVQKQQEIARDRLGSCVMVKTDDLSLNADGLHLTTDSQIILGQRFATARASLTSD